MTTTTTESKRARRRTFKEVATEAYAKGWSDARERFEVRIAGWTLTPGVQPGMIWISDAGGEGGDFHIDELAEVIGKFYKEKF